MAVIISSVVSSDIFLWIRKKFYITAPTEGLWRPIAAITISIISLIFSTIRMSIYSSFALLHLHFLKIHFWWWLFIYLLFLFHRLTWPKIIYPQHPVRGIIKTPGNLSELHSSVKPVASMVNEIDIIHIFTPSLQQDLYQKLINCVNSILFWVFLDDLNRLVKKSIRFAMMAPLI